MAAAPRMRFHSSAIDRLRTTALVSGAPSSRQIAPCLTRRRAGARQPSSASPAASAPIATSRQKTMRPGMMVGSIGRREERVDRPRVGGADGRRRVAQGEQRQQHGDQRGDRRRRRSARAARRAGRRRSTSAQPATRSGARQRYACAMPACFHSPADSQSRCPPSTAANIAPTAPMPRPATRSIRTPASCSARSTPA